MPSEPIDLRSDTVTLPTAGMREAMAAAPLGDDVFGEDPSVNALEEQFAALLGKEAALFVPSGTMSNLIGVGVHCQPGDELICEVGCHIYNYEQGGYARIHGAAVRTVVGEQGVIDPRQLVDLVRPDNEHLVRTRLVCLENTHNRGSGRVLPYEGVTAICAWAHENGLAAHLDGARLFNAVVATSIEAREWARHFDTVSVCFSKGLGTPVGSALAGPRASIAKARRLRKLFGGGMRQAGVIAAAARYALDHHIDRLADDHAHAARLAAALGQCDGVTLPGVIDTNIVFFHLDPRLGTAANVSARLAEQGVLVIALGPQDLRAVTHLGVTSEQIEQAIDILRRVLAESAGGQPATTAARRSPYA